MEYIGEFWNSMVFALSSIYSECKVVSGLFLSFLGIFAFHKGIYFLIGLFFTRKFEPAKNQHKYAILIPARNEEAVVGNLLKSIKRQDYNQDLITTFVIADNCTDHTAEVARQQGAVCYERFNNQDRTKGFALEFLFNRIEEDYGIDSFEGYFVFDSDNLLNRNYISKMNDAFDSGEKIITSYRNTKNFDENWVASTYALHWLRSIRFRHRARSFLHLATNIQGTGFLFANELVKDGWHYTSLTEDRAFTADAVAHGYEISYQDEAVFYDEQPTSLRIALRQRTRWSKGHMLAFMESGWSLFKNIFVGNCFRDKSERHQLTWENFVEGVRHRWASFDTLGQLIPTPIPKLFVWLFVNVILYSCFAYTYGLNDAVLFKTSNWLGKFLSDVFGVTYINAAPGFHAMIDTILLASLWHAISKISWNIKNMFAAVYIFFIERKRIKKIKFRKKVLYCLTWPTFDMIYRYSMYAALFMKVTWKPIPHTSKVTIEDIEN
ncbi:MAG: glycosyltransferase family 2 protein [Lachnospiraceae bacterium]|nr:glycosyltransferase family 2 protein [Lachnospiraceae bacterium]